MIGLKTDKERIHSILEVLMAYARLEFDSSVKLTGSQDELDGIGIGINMLGEELKATTISIKEKENMLREIHHRVKNNLQIINSLLNLQIQKENDDKVRDFARESQSRIRAISLIHEMLYKSPDFKYSSFKVYSEILVSNIMLSYALPEQDIDIQIDIAEDLVLDIDRLIPLGLILNESVSNAVKYAFPHGSGQIKVISTRNGSKNKLSIGDNGRGLDEGFDLENDGNLGMKLIFMLAEQADMHINMENHIGLTYNLEF